MKYKLILFDVDDTLFDFRGSEKSSFTLLMEQVGVSGDFDAVYAGYRKLSRPLWDMLEAGQISKEHLKVERFRQLFALHQIEADPEFASRTYLKHLSESALLLDGAIDICRHLHKESRLGIITNGIEFVQKSRLERSGLAPYFDFMIVSEACGFNKPDRRIFEYTLRHAAHDELETVLMIGDRLEADVAGALNMGVDACWYNPQGLANESEIRPHFEIRHLSELSDLVKTGPLNCA